MSTNKRRSNNVLRSAAEGYPKAVVTNSTQYPCTAYVSYLACSDDSTNSILPGGWWTPSDGRGLCLIDHVYSVVSTPNGNVNAAAYSSSGTSYSQFAVIFQNPGYTVTRVTDPTSDQEEEVSTEQRNTGYPLVTIYNSTPYKVWGTVKYLDAEPGFCTDDDYTINPWEYWQAGKRGVCLVRKISAQIHGHDDATPYVSTGTSYSQFAVIYQPNNKFSVTRIVT